ncbi:hypothetical protein NYO98_19790 [Nocardioides sp. STR2]|uniref:Uncharacterized protein n=1 Tax=Nocardioides pini TaxID=2975053 RepID=A0ABT4CHU4_9ACTN|nr:hypothetical protein [Nocardioides pini]MCY4728533.1 hypothetical protein [Nocardioides pini]
MPNAARPLRTHPARAVGEASASPARTRATSPAPSAGTSAGTSVGTASATSTAGSLPSAWGASGQQLLLEQSAALGTRSPINVALLESTTGADTTATADLSAIWTLAEEPGRPAARITIRRLDPKGRLMLPLTLSKEIKVDVLAECDGPVLTLFLPGAEGRPALQRVVAPLALDSRGRLAVKQATRTRLGWTPGTDVLIAFDAEKQTITLTAASVLLAISQKPERVLNILRSSTCVTPINDCRWDAGAARRMASVRVALMALLLLAGRWP